MKKEIRLTTAGNTMAPCCIVLEDLGYTVSNKMVGDEEMWVAEKERQRLSGRDPCEVLGLAKLIEVRGTNWQVSDNQIADYLKRFYGIS